jgi:hypothetical protein
MMTASEPSASFEETDTRHDETEATGDADDLVPALLDAAAALDVDMRVVGAAEWDHGDAKGVCKHRTLHECQSVIEAKARSNQTDLALTSIHEYAHALLHFDVDDEPERAKREVEAEAVAYIVGRYFDLDTSGSAFYLAAWQDDDAEGIQERLGRISSTAQEIIGTVAEG